MTLSGMIGGEAPGWVRQDRLASQLGVEATAAPSALTPFDVLQNAFIEVDGVVSRVERLANRLAGPVPEKESGPGNVAGNGLFDAVTAGAQAAVVRVQAAHRALERIERMLPGGDR